MVDVFSKYKKYVYLLTIFNMNSFLQAKLLRFAKKRGVAMYNYVFSRMKVMQQL